MSFRSIEPNVNIPLFKYYGNIDFAKDAIEKGRIHLEEPAVYNDIYDSSYMVKAADLKRYHYGKFLQVDFLKKYYEFLKPEEIEELSKQDLSIGDLIDYLCNLNKEINKENFIRDTLFFVSNGGKIIQPSNNRISCFSEVNDSLLMWAYYANCYSGLCLRFNAPRDDILSKHCRKVQYTNHYISDSGFGNFFRKSLQWSHEQEWRIVCYTKEEYMPVNSIDAIYLGYRMDTSTKHQFVELGAKKRLEVYEMAPSTEKYEILFEKII